MHQETSERHSDTAHKKIQNLHSSEHVHVYTTSILLHISHELTRMLSLKLPTLIIRL